MKAENTTQTGVRREGHTIEVQALNALRLERRTDFAQTAQAAANYLAGRLRDIAAHKQWVSLAVSGGRTPVLLFEQLARHDVPWSQIHLFQVDERCVADDDPSRNDRQLGANSEGGAVRGLAGLLKLHGTSHQLHLMPVWPMEGLEQRMAAYSDELLEITNGELDIVHLGLGDDGHTASLVPGDPVLQETEASVALTDFYQGTRRVTLTYPTLERAGELLWLAPGASKASVIPRLLRADPTIPAGRLGTRPGTLFIDDAAATNE